MNAKKATPDGTTELSLVDIGADTIVAGSRSEV